MPFPERAPTPPAAADSEPEDPTPLAAPIVAGDSASPSRLPEATLAPQREPAPLQSTCISRSPGTIRGMVSIPAADPHAALAAIVARRLAVASVSR